MSSVAGASLVVGLFVGGQGTRMGGVAKGKLRAPGSELTLVERLLLEIAAALPGSEVVLVGDAADYRALGLEAVEDRPPNIGPLGGLAGLLAYAEHRGAQHALALACDLPRLDRLLIARLAGEGQAAACVLVRQALKRNPLIARYSVQPAAIAVAQALQGNQRSLQAVLDRLEPAVLALVLEPDEEARLVDWDTPGDID